MSGELADGRAVGMAGTKPSCGAGQAFGAWLVASLAASAAIVLGFLALDFASSPLPLEQVGHNLLTAIPLSLYVSVVVVVLTALPMIALVYLLRLTRIRLGVGDVLLGGAMGAALIQLLNTTSANSEAAATTLLFFIAGMVGGLTYWHVAGRPR